MAKRVDLDALDALAKDAKDARHQHDIGMISFDEMQLRQAKGRVAILQAYPAMAAELRALRAKEAKSVDFLDLDALRAFEEASKNTNIGPIVYGPRPSDEPAKTDAQLKEEFYRLPRFSNEDRRPDR